MAFITFPSNFKQRTLTFYHFVNPDPCLCYDKCTNKYEMNSGNLLPRGTSRSVKYYEKISRIDGS